MLHQSVKPLSEINQWNPSLALRVLSLFFQNILCLEYQPFVTNPSLPEQWALPVEPRHKQLCEILCKSFFMFSFTFQSRTCPLSKPSMVATWEKVHGDLLFFFVFFFPLNFVKWTKRIFIEKSCIFSSEAPLKHGVWNESCLGVTFPESIRSLLSAQSTSAGPSALTSIHERSRVTKVLLRKKGSMWDGTNQSTKYSFPLHVRCPSGDSDGVTDTATGVGVFFFFFLLSFLMGTVAFLFSGLRPLSAACTVWSSIISWVCPKESLFRLWLFRHLM